MIPLGIRYGKGLQMVNILRDLPEDLKNGRCYIPEVLLKQVNLSPEKLLDPSSAQAFRPLFRQLIQEARGSSRPGLAVYTMAIPRMEVRLRLACMWPILIGIRTLQALSTSPDLLSAKKVHQDCTTGRVWYCGRDRTHWGVWFCRDSLLGVLAKTNCLREP